MMGVAISGTYLYAGTNKGSVVILDISDLSKIEKGGSMKLSGGVEGIQTKDQTLFVGTDAGGVFSFNIANPLSPVQIYNLPTTSCDELSITGNFLYVADWGGGAKIVDISNPANLTTLSSISTPGKVWEAKENGGYLYLAKNNGEVSIYNISNPSSPVLINTITNSSLYKNSQSISLEDNYLYTIDDGMGVQVFNVTNPATPLLLQTNSSTTITRIDNAIQSGQNYILASPGRGIRIVNSSLKEIGSYSGLGGNSFDVYQTDNILYAGFGGSGLAIIDISDMTNPTLLGQYDTPGWSYGVVNVGDYTYVGDNDSLQVVNVKDKAAPTLQTSIPLTTGCFGLIKSENTLLLSCATSVHIFDISTPSLPVEVGNVPATSLKNFAFDSIKENVFILESSNQIKVYNISNPVFPSILATYVSPTSYTGGALAFKDDKLYFAISVAYSSVFDVSDLQNFKELSAIPLWGPTNFNLTETTLMASGQFRGFYLFKL